MQLPDHGLLNGIHILIFIDDDMPKPPSEPVAQAIVPIQFFDGLGKDTGIV